MTQIDPERRSNDLLTKAEVGERQVKGEIRPFVGIRQYTNEFSPKLTKPGFVKRCRLIFYAIRPKLIEDYYGWFVAIEPDSGDYFIDAAKEVAQQQARQKYPERMLCTLRLIETGASNKIW